MSVNRTWTGTYLPATIAPGETQVDYRARLLRLQEQESERRSAALGEQSSVNLSPQERIRLWETLHELQLPRQSDHSVLSVIATDTGLTLEQVAAEQRVRFPP